MSLWKDILMFGAQGRLSEARALLAFDLPMSLRELPQTSRGSREYRGALPQAVRRFSAKLPEQERTLIQSYEREFTDYLLDDVVVGVERALKLIELCLAYPTATLAELVDFLPWDQGLKRSQEWKQSWIADHLRSFLAAEIPLPTTIVEMLEARGAPEYEFNEIAFAIAPKRLELSWKDFKQQQGYAANVLSISEDAATERVADEGFDYGVIPMAEIVLQQATKHDLELGIDLQIFGRRVSGDLTELLDARHDERPHDGYRPIAWHHVFWSLFWEYERMKLSMEMRDPYRDTDQELADHIKDNYPEVKSTSRPMISRRRNFLAEACDKLIREKLLERFARRNGSNEQTESRITQVAEGLSK